MEILSHQNNIITSGNVPLTYTSEPSKHEISWYPANTFYLLTTENPYVDEYAPYYSHLNLKLDKSIDPVLPYVVPDRIVDNVAYIDTDKLSIDLEGKGGIHRAGWHLTMDNVHEVHAWIKIDGWPNNRLGAGMYIGSSYNRKVTFDSLEFKNIHIDSEAFMPVYYTDGIDTLDLRYLGNVYIISNGLHQSIYYDSNGWGNFGGKTVTRVLYPNTFNTIGTNRLFTGCQFKEFDLSHFKNLKSADYMFQQCTKLERITYTPETFNHLLTCQGMFYGCSSLTGSIADIVQHLRMSKPATDALWMFKGCTSMSDYEKYKDTYLCEGH